MCFPVAAAGAAAGGAAAATSTALSVAGLAISAVSTVAGIAQAQQAQQMQAQMAQQQAAVQQAQYTQQMDLQAQQYAQGMEAQVNQFQASSKMQYAQALANQQFQVASANENRNMQMQQLDLQYRNAQQMAFNERAQALARYTGEARAQQAAANAAITQTLNNNAAANRSYVSEQIKLQEARTKAAFEQQGILAKQIGQVGKVLAAGQSGQSIGLLAMDAERQAGYSMAMQTATLESAEKGAWASMEGAFTEAQSANNRAQSSIPLTVQHPFLSPDPAGIGKDLKLGIPSYQWGRS